MDEPAGAADTMIRPKHPRRIPREAPIFLFLVVLCAAVALLRHSFLSVENLRNLGVAAAPIGIMAVGMTAVIITGGIDLSVAAVLSLSALVGGQMIAHGNTTLGIAAVLATGLGCGALNGVLITLAKVPPIIATLGALYIIQNGATLYSGGQMVDLGSHLAFLGSGFVPLLIVLLVFAAGMFVMHSTRAGRYVYAAGGNEEAARLAGVNVRRIKIWVYAASGLLAALAGLVMMGIGSTFQASDADGYELSVIAAVVIGGTSIMGGEGSMLGTLIGVGVSIVLSTGAILVGLDPKWTQAVIGAAIFLAVAVDRLRRR
jgi:ribose transport system permease protein